MSDSTQIIFGLHSVLALLQHHPEKVKHLYYLSGRHDQRLQQVLALAKQHQRSMQASTRADLDKLTARQNHQGIAAEVIATIQECYNEDFLEQLLMQETATTPLLLVLDQIQDPHNFGACLRTAAAVGVDAVVITKDRSVGLTPTVRKVASGAAEIVPVVQVVNLARTLRQLQECGVWLRGAEMTAAKSLYELDLCVPGAIILGAEGSGLRRLTREICDELFMLPMQNSMESLNVSVACGVCLYEAYRQRARS